MLPKTEQCFGQDQPEARKVSVCIVSHNGYGAISGGNDGHIGGVERQTSLLANWLAKRGHAVSYLTWHEGGAADEMINGVRVVKICRKDSGLPGLRFVHPRWSGLVHAMRIADAEVYYQNCGGCVTGQASIWCRRNGRPFIFSLASDADCTIGLPELKVLRERLLYKHGLRNATMRVVQTESQGHRLKEYFGLDSEVIPMAAPEPESASINLTGRPMDRILWIGRLCRVKRPHLMLEIAQACPDLTFYIAGPVYGDSYALSAAERAKTMPNVRLLGAVPRAGVSDLYRSASLLCCTSDYEGFPNTFLEAWSHGVPIVSTVDPDGLIESRGLGRVGTNLPSLISGIRELLENAGSYQETSASARSYFSNRHSIEAVMPRFEQLFVRLTDKTKGCHLSS